MSLHSIGVYRIVTQSGKVYIGMTTQSFKIRWQQHHTKLRHGIHHNRGLQNAYNRDGWESFKKEILIKFEKPTLTLPNTSLESEILYLEKISWIKHKNSGFVLLNGKPTGSGSVFHTEKTKEKIKESRLANGDSNNPRMIFTPLEVQEIKKEYENGAYVKDVSLKFNKNIKALRNLIRAQNFQRPY